MRVAGTVAASDLAVLRDAVAGSDLPDRVDLAEVELVDSGGAKVLLDLEARGARLVGATPYVELLLRTPPGPISREGGERNG